jgi:hypothetical protein
MCRSTFLLYCCSLNLNNLTTPLFVEIALNNSVFVGGFINVLKIEKNSQCTNSTAICKPYFPPINKVNLVSSRY